MDKRSRVADQVSVRYPERSLRTVRATFTAYGSPRLFTFASVSPIRLTRFLEIRRTTPLLTTNSIKFPAVGKMSVYHRFTPPSHHGTVGSQMLSVHPAENQGHSRLLSFRKVIKFFLETIAVSLHWGSRIPLLTIETPSPPSGLQARPLN